MHKRLWNIYMFMILFIGTLSSLSVLFFKNETLNVFNKVSPLPLVYSFDKDRLPKRSGMKIILLSNNTETQFLLDRAFFQKIGGPHNYRIGFWSKLVRAQVLTHKSLDGFLQNFFCDSGFDFNDLGRHKVKAIKILDAKDTVIRYWSCTQ